MKRSKQKKSTLLFEELEPRLLFSADAMAALAVDAVQQDFAEKPIIIEELDTETEADISAADQPESNEPTPLPTQTTNEEIASGEKTVEPGVVPESNTETPTETPVETEKIDSGQANATDNTTDTNQKTTSTALSETTSSKELVFLGDNVSDGQKLVDDLLQENKGERSIELVILDHKKDGFQQISKTLQKYDDLDAIHFITHGSDASIGLGDDWLNSATLQDNSDTVAGWGNALKDTGDILFYGCNVAGGEGQNLLGDIANLTGADVAASDDLTGSIALGGDWDLEYRVGAIETKVAVSADTQQDWLALLAETIYISNENSTNTSEIKSDANWGQTFKYGSGNGTYNVNRLSLQLSKGSSTISQTITVYLETSWKSNDLAASVSISSDSLTMSQSWQNFDFKNIELNDNTTYYIRVSSNSTDGKIWLGTNSSGSYANGDKIDVNGLPLGGEDLAFRVSEVITNTAPTASDSTITLAEDNSHVFAADNFGFHDPDSGDTISAVRIDSLPAKGSLKLNGTAVTAGQVINIGDINGNELTYDPVAQESGNGYSTFTYSVRDAGGLFDLTPNTMTINVTSVNDQPTATNVNQTINYTQGAASVDLGDIVVSDADTNEQIRATLTIADPSTGALRYTVNGSTNTAPDFFTTSGTVAQVNAVLASVTFIPAADNDKNTSVAVYIRDHFEDGTRAVRGTINLNVTAKNEAPTVTLANTTTTLAEDLNTSSSVKVADIVVTDDGLGTNSLTLAGADAALFDIVGGNQLHIKAGAALDFETNPALDVTVQVDDTTVGNTPDDTANLTITVTNINEAPNDLTAIATSAGGLSLNQNGGNDAYLIADNGAGLLGGLTQLTYEMQFETTHVSTLNTLVSYAEPADSNEFTLIIRNDGKLSAYIGTAITSSTFDHKTLEDGNKHSLAITWDSTGGAWNIFVDGNLVDHGTGHNTGKTILGKGTLVFGQEQDSLDGGYDASQRFSGTLYDARLFNTIRSATEIKASYQSTLPSNETGLVANWTFNDFSVNATTGNRVVTDTVSGNNLTAKNVGSGGGFSASTPVLTFAVRENASDNTVIGSVIGSDPDSGDTLSYSLSDNAGGAFAINATSGEITVADTSLIDYETASTMNITVRVTGTGSLTYDKVFTININDVNDQLTATNITQTKGYIEGAASVALNDIVVSDVDVSEVIWVKLQIADPSTGALTAGSGNGETYTASTGQWYVTGNVTQVNAALAAVTFTPATDNDQNTTVTIDIRDGGENGTVPVTGVINLNVTAKNDDPVNNASLPAAIAVTEDVLGNVDLSAIDLSDADAGTSSLTLTLTTTTGGNLTAAAGTGITIGGTSAALKLTGTLGNLNNYLNTASNLQYLHGTPNTSGKNEDSIKIEANDNGNTGSGGGANVKLGIVKVNISAFNDAPLFANLDGNPTFVEDGPPVVMDVDATIFDAELSGINDFGGTTLTLARTGGANSQDRFSPSGNVVASGHPDFVIRVGGVRIGTYTHSGGELAMTFESGATAAQVNNVIQTIRYQNNSSAPPSSVQIQWTFSDQNTVAQGSGGALTATGNTTVNITATNDAPVLTLPGASITYTENDPATIIDATATITDYDSGNFDTGTLTIDFSTGGTADDKLAILSTGNGQGQIGISGNQISHEGTLIGTFIGGTDGTTPLVITFNLNANKTSVQDVMRHITYKNVSENPNANARTVRFVMTDGDGDNNTSKEVTKTINVAAINDAPTFLIGDGIVTTAIGSNSDLGQSVVVEPDGKILVAGYSYNGSKWDFALARYNSNGTLEKSFDGDGKLTTALGSGDGRSYSVAVQPDGKILLAGYSNSGSNNDFALVRYNVDGSLDTSFDGDGKLTTDIGLDSDIGLSVAVQSDGKILVAGESNNGSNNDFALVRYYADGSLDTNFSSDGKLTTAIGSGTDSGNSVAVQPDGKILVAGGSYNGSYEDFALVRYNTDGSLDTSFDGDGKLTTDIGLKNDRGNSVVVQSDGKILVAGESYNGSNYDFALVRYNSDGTLDTSFNDDGKLTTDFESGLDYGRSVTVQSDGKILVAGFSSNGFNWDFALVRYNADGSLDTRFDSTFTNTLDGTPIYTEGGTAVVLDANVSIFDAELSAANNFNGARLTLVRNGGASAEDLFSASGNLSALTQGGNITVDGTNIGEVTTNSGGSLVLTFNANATNTLVNSAMRQIAYSNSSNTPPTNVQLDWAFNDGNDGVQGNGSKLTATGSTTVRITAVNDAPSGRDGNITVTEDSDYTFKTTDFGFSDIDGDSFDRVWITKLPAQGTLKFNGSVFNVGNYIVASDIDEGRLTYTPPGDANGSPFTSFTFIVQDDGGTANGGVNRDTTANTITININAVNDAPSISNATFQLTENSSNGTVVGNVPVSDPDSGDTHVYTITSGNTNGAFAISSSGDITVANSSALDFETTQVFNLTVQVKDQGGAGLSDTAAITVTLTDQTETVSFTIDTIADTSVAENAVFTSVTSNLTGDTPIGNITYTLGGTDAGLFTVNSSTGVVSMIARDFEAPADNNTDNIYEVTLVATDADSNTASKTFKVTVTDEVESATFTIDTIADTSVAENVVFTSAVPNLSGATPIGNVIYSLAGNDAGLFTVDAGTGVVSMIARDFEAPADNNTDNIYEVTLVATDADSNTDSEDFTVTVMDEVESATFTIDTITNAVIAENSAFTSGVPSLSGATPIGNVTYSLAGNDAGLFTVDAGTGVVSMIARDFEAPADNNTDNIYEVTLVATDADSNTASKTFKVTVTDEVESATFTIDTIADTSVAENVVFTSAVPNLSGATPIGNVIYSLAGNDAGLFTVDAGTGVVSMIARDFETPSDNNTDNIYEVTLVATDADSNTDSEDFTVEVTDQTETVSFAIDTIPNAVIAENSAFTSVTPNLSGTTPIGNVTYSLSGTDAGLFTVDAGTGVVSMIARDFEAPADNNTDNIYEVTLVATDADSNTDSEDFTVEVTDQTETVSFAIDTIPNAVIAENSVFTSVTPNLSGTTPIGNVTYSLSGTDAGLFTVDAGTGVVSMIARDFEAPADNNTDNIYEVTLVATDADSNTDSEDFTVTVMDEVESATFTIDTITNAVIAENSAFTSVAPNLSGATPIGNVTYSLAGNDAGLFTVDAGTGVVSMIARDFEAPVDGNMDNTYEVILVATDADGNTDSETFSVTISDVDFPPVISGVDAGIVTEDIDPDSDNLLETSGALTIADPDIGQSLFNASTISGTYGDLSIDSAGNWSYTAANNQAAIQQLDATASVTDTFTVTSADGTTHNVVITINGADEASVDVQNGSKTDYGTTLDTGIPNDPIDPVDTVDDKSDDIEIIEEAISGEDNFIEPVYTIYDESNEIFNATEDDFYITLPGDQEESSVNELVDSPYLVVDDIEITSPKDQHPTGEEVETEDYIVLPASIIDIVKSAGGSVQDKVSGVSQSFEDHVTRPETQRNVTSQAQVKNFNGVIRQEFRLAEKQAWDLSTPDMDIFVSEQSFDPETIERQEKAIQTGLENMRQEIDQAFEDSVEHNKISTYITSGAGVSFSAGLMSYLLRGGSLMSSFLATVPLWKGFDPIAILGAPKKKKNKKTAGGNIEKRDVIPDQNVENMFSGKENR